MSLKDQRQALVDTFINAIYESPPSHQKPVHIVCWFFLMR